MSETIEQIEQIETTKVKSKAVDKKEGSADVDFSGIEILYEKNKKTITYAGVAILAVVAIFSFYKFYWLPEQELEANNESFFAQSYFEKDSFLVALNGNINVSSSEGNKQMMGFKDIAENYSLTKTGNLANFYAGVCLLRTGKFEEAISYLEKFSGDDEMIAPVAIGAIGDANMELKKTDEAIKFYLNAAQQSTNAFTTPIYLKKAAFAYETNGNYADALATYERLKNEYSESSESRDINKYIARVKTLGNIQ